MSAVDDLLEFVEGRDLTVSLYSDLVTDANAARRWSAATADPCWPHDQANPLERVEYGATVYEAAAQLVKTLRTTAATHGHIQNNPEGPDAC